MLGTIIDVALIAIIVISAIIGIVRGFLDSILGLVGTTIAGIASLFLAKFVAPFVNKIFGLESFLLGKLDTSNGGSLDVFGTTLENAEIAKFAVWVITVIAVYLIIKFAIFILAKIFESVVKNSPTISGINRVLGMIFGVVKGTVSAALLVAILSLLGKVPGISTTINDKIAETKVCKWADKYVDDIMETYLTQDNIRDIVDRIISEEGDTGNSSGDTSTDTTPESTGTPSTSVATIIRN